MFGEVLSRHVMVLIEMDGKSISSDQSIYLKSQSTRTTSGNRSSNSSSMDTDDKLVDDELAKVTEESLSMGEHETRVMLDEARIQWPRHKYASLYTATQHELIVDDARVRLTFYNSNRGVPGFPDFPDCWQGCEGGTKTKSSSSSSSSSPLTGGGDSSSHKSNLDGPPDSSSLLHLARKRESAKPSVVLPRKRHMSWKRKAVNRQGLARRRTTRRQSSKVSKGQETIANLSLRLANLKCVH